MKNMQIWLTLTSTSLSFVHINTSAHIIHVQCPYWVIDTGEQSDVHWVWKPWHSQSGHLNGPIFLTDAFNFISIFTITNKFHFQQARKTVKIREKGSLSKSDLSRTLQNQNIRYSSVKTSKKSWWMIFLQYNPLVGIFPKNWNNLYFKGWQGGGICFRIVEITHWRAHPARGA